MTATQPRRPAQFVRSSFEAGGLAPLVRRHLHLRGLAALGSAPGAKEWLHFCIVAPGVDVLINFSLMRDLRPAALPGDESARVIVLVRDQTGWSGGVQDIDRKCVEIQRRDVRGRFGRSWFEFRDGEFEVVASLDQPAHRVHVRLLPLAMPVVRRPFVKDAMSWGVAPRFAVTGEIALDGRTVNLDGAMAYHDHNWGSWLWGQDCVWQWGFGLPTEPQSPWSFVFMRLLDRRHLRDLNHELLLWRGPIPIRHFRTGEVSFRYRGMRGAKDLKKFPGAMRLLAPELARDVPEQIEVRATAREDRLDCAFQITDVAQLLVPNEVDLGITYINECTARFSCTGTIGGESISFGGKSVLEFLTVDSN